MLRQLPHLGCTCVPIWPSVFVMTCRFFLQMLTGKPITLDVEVSELECRCCG